MITEWQDETLQVLVEWVKAPSAKATIAVGGGTIDGRAVTFAGDWRPMLALAEAIRDRGGPVEAEVPRWAIL